MRFAAHSDTSKTVTDTSLGVLSSAGIGPFSLHTAAIVVFLLPLLFEVTTLRAQTEVPRRQV